MLKTYYYDYTSCKAELVSRDAIIKLLTNKNLTKRTEPPIMHDDGVATIQNSYIEDGSQIACIIYELSKEEYNKIKDLYTEPKTEYIKA